MQIMPIRSTDGRTLQKRSRVRSVSFSGSKQEVIPIITDPFKTETAKKLYSKISKYIRLAGSNGNVKDIKIMSEEGHYFTKSPQYYVFFDSKADITMSYQRNNDSGKLVLNRKYADPKRGDTTLIEATFNKEGQMIKGIFPQEFLTFKRDRGNVRRMKRYENANFEQTILPVGGNDRDWGCCGGGFPTLYLDRSKDNSSSGAFEIFIELARLKTSIYR